MDSVSRIARTGSSVPVQKAGNSTGCTAITRLRKKWSREKLSFSVKPAQTTSSASRSCSLFFSALQKLPLFGNSERSTR